MSLHFLLDGYNIIKQTPHLNRGTLEQQREALLSWVNIHTPQGQRCNGVTVVFDGKYEFFGSHSISDVKAIFSKGQSADELIKKIVEKYPKKDLIVVSDDKDIKHYVRALGASVLSVKEFMAKAIKKTKTSASGAMNKGQVMEKYISLTQQEQITQELQKIWIKPKP